VAAAVGLLALLGYGLVGAPGAARAGGRINANRATVDLGLRPAAPFATRLFDGGALDLAALRGQVALLNFWASWCQPCRDEAPALAALDARFRGRGARVVGLNVWDQEAAARRFLRQNGLGYPSGPDGGTTAVEYGVRGVPETYLIDQQSRLVRRWIGPLDPDDAPEVVRALKEGEAPLPGRGLGDPDYRLPWGGRA
jgi:cytochrome c biogenesis protein CcmG/thiol:disulfide interchange protein DsbE